MILDFYIFFPLWTYFKFLLYLHIVSKKSNKRLCFISNKSFLENQIGVQLSTSIIKSIPTTNYSYSYYMKFTHLSLITKWPAFGHGNLALTKKMQLALSIPKLFHTHGSGQFALIVSPLVPFQGPKFLTMISVEVNLAMFWAPSTDAEELQLKQLTKWLILYLLKNHTRKGLKL